MPVARSPSHSYSQTACCSRKLPMPLPAPSLHPGPYTVPARAGETLLEAGLRAGLVLPYDCRSGGCGLCLCTVLNGRVDPGPYQDAALTEAMRARGQALMCCATALEDVELELDVASIVAGGAATMQHETAVVERMELLAPDVMGLWLALPPGRRIDYQAGNERVRSLR